MNKEIDALELNDTWTIEELLPGKKPINCKWVYKVKYNLDGSIERYKVPLVILGDGQVEGFDYNDICSNSNNDKRLDILLLLVQQRGGSYIKWMYIMHSCMEI